MPFDKKAYSREYAQRKLAEKRAKEAATLAKRQANAAKARAAKAAKNGHAEAAPVLMARAPARWHLSDGRIHIDVGSGEKNLAVILDNKLVVNLNLMQPE